jgi:hypothetical protein
MHGKMPLLPRKPKEVEIGIQVVPRRLKQHRMTGMPSSRNRRKRVEVVLGVRQQQKLLKKRRHRKQMPGIMCSKRRLLEVFGVRQ